MKPQMKKIKEISEIQWQAFIRSHKSTRKRKKRRTKFRKKISSLQITPVIFAANLPFGI
jgi:hypothetical protein